jgi:peptidoglycan/LPS O-acetylase OafA/YrhL
MTSMFCTLVCAYFSDRLQLRYPFLLLGSLFCLLGWALELATVSFIDPKTGLGWAGQRCAGMFCISIGESISIPVLATWLSNNLRGRKERVVGLATVIGGAQAGNFVSANVFITGQEKMGYETGFATGLGITIVAIVAGVVLFVALLKENEKLARRGAELEGSGELGADERGWRNTL